MNSDHLRALTAAVDHGTFDAAADELGISGSAFSQRIKALERQVGQVLLARTVPVTATTAGARLLRTARQILALEDEALTSLGQGPGGRTALEVAVNADSLATWFGPVLREAATWDDVVLHLHTEDQEHTAELLRAGTAVAAVTQDPEPVSGCTAVPIGTMRYHAVASAYLLDLHRDPAGRLDLTRVPVVDYGVRDGLQRTALARALRRQGRNGIGFRGALGGAGEAAGAGAGEASGLAAPAPPHHLIPSVEGYLCAVEVGLGWGLLPEDQVPAGVLEGVHRDLVPVTEIGSVAVDLHWQRWTAGTEALDRLTDAVLRAAPRPPGR